MSDTDRKFTNLWNSYRRNSRKLFVLCVVGPLWGCAISPVPTINDLRLASIKWLDAQSAVRLGLRPSKILADGGTIEIELSTKYDFVDIAQKYELNIAGEYAPCPLKENAISLSGSSIYLYGIRLNPNGIDPNKQSKYREFLATRKENSDFIYLIHVSYKNDPLYPQIKPYNLYDNPQNLCVRVSGGNMSTRFESNIVVIPKNEISNLLKAAGVK